MEYKKISYSGKNYGVFTLKYKTVDIPILLDWNDFKYIYNLNKTWYIDGDSGFVLCHHDQIDIYLHEVVLALEAKEEGILYQKGAKPIIHINKFGIDNRRINLMYDETNKIYNKNLKKKERIIELPKDSNIDIDELPTYMWYIKPNGTHGDRFIVNIKNTSWKTTASTKVSLRYKFEEAKKYLRELKEEQPELFDEYCMNGEYTKKGKELVDSFYKIINKAGFLHINKINVDNITDKYLEPKYDNLSIEEKRLLKATTLLNNKRKKLLFTKLPKDSGLKQNDLPNYCYYIEETDSRGDHFVIESHPKQDRNTKWQTTTAKNIPTVYKYNQMIEYIKSLNQQAQVQIN